MAMMRRGVVAGLVLGRAFAEQKAAAAASARRIVGGADAPAGEYPWMAALLWASDGTNEYEQQGCGGTLIDADWVLTAAHCGIEGMPTHVLVGARDLLSWEDEDYGSGRPEKRAVVGYVMHPSYDDFWIHHDVLLLQLEAPSSLETLELAAATPDPGTSVIAIGWGDTHASDDVQEFPHVLQAVTVDVIECETAIDDIGHESYLCASPPDSGEDACQGDSGGPLVARQTDGAYTLVGATSWGVGCTGGGVYADVADYHDFVGKVLTGEICADSATWSQSGQAHRDCLWIATKPESRCKYQDGDCQATCGCVQDPPTQSPTARPTPRPTTAKSDDGCGEDRATMELPCSWFTDAAKCASVPDSADSCPTQCCAAASTCEDDASWFKKNKPTATCAWVAKKPEKRCRLKDAASVRAEDACLVTCGTCPN